MNAWEDVAVIDEVNRVECQVFAGLRTLVCIVLPVLSALEQSFDVYVITDASGDIAEEAHARSVQRMIQAGALPMTSLQYRLEMQRDRARVATYDFTTGLAKRMGGTRGLGTFLSADAMQLSR